MLLKLVYVIIATIITIFFLIMLGKGKKYNPWVENLNDNDYPFKGLYVAGFAMNETGLFKLRGNLERKLKNNTKLIMGEQYYEYYALLAWAQFLSLSFAVLSICFSLAALIGGTASYMMLGIGILFMLAIWNLCMSKMKEAVDKRRDECDLEFPNMVSKLALLINSGMVLRDAWMLVAEGKDGTLYDLMKTSCDDMRNGSSDSVAIHKFGVLTDSPEIKKFASALMQTIEKGNSGLSDFLIMQTSELWAHKRQLALQKGEVAAGKLIIPLGITFAGIIMIIISASLQSMSF